MNLCFNALDLRVVKGDADQPALLGTPPLHLARLLEEVGALGGVFRAVGVEAGHSVGIGVGDRRVELLSLLAALRIGATVVELREGRLAEHKPFLVVTDTHLDYSDHTPGTVVLHGPEPVDERRDLAWAVGMRAGRTEPAPSVEMADDSIAWVLDTPVRLADALADESRYGAWLRDLTAGVPVDPVTS